jgi:hypothetical protein
MTHHDTGPMLPNEMAPETVDSVRLALECYFEAAHSDAAPRLQVALHNFAREARLKGISPAQVLATLKSIWHALPAVTRARDHDEQTRILQRVVAICIKEYFAD